jgi:hyperosmotically inducible protein
MKSVALIAVAFIALPILGETHASAPAPAAVQSVVDKTKDVAGKTTDAVVKGAKAVGDKTEDGVSKTGEVMTDGWITTRVHAQFVDEALLKDSNITVETNNHVVTLTGTVLARAGRTRATAVARGTEGVRQVINRLIIGPKR